MSRCLIAGEHAQKSGDKSPHSKGMALFLGLVLLGGPLGTRLYAAGEGLLTVTVVDDKTHQPISCRMHLVGPGKRPRKADPMPFWSDHFVFPGKITLKLPVGKYTFQIQRGPEYLTQDGHFVIDHFAEDSKEVPLRRFVDLTADGWYSGDLYVRRPVRDAELLMSADDLHVAQFVTWWNDKIDSPGRAEPKQPLVCFDENRCYQTKAGGFARGGTELLYFNLPAPLHQDPSGARGASAEYPSEMKYLLKARENPDTWVDLTAPYWWDLPMLVAMGQVDSIEVLNSHMCRHSLIMDEGDGRPRDRKLYQNPFGNARWSQHIYFQLLECGLRIPPSAGSGSGVAPNPLGYNRVYVHLDGPFSYEAWWKNFRAGHVFVTNGPLLRPTVEGELPGHVFRADAGKELDLDIGLTLSTADPISYLEIIQNGQIKESVRLDQFIKTGRLPHLHFKQSGWFLIRAVTDLSDTYRFAMTAPYYVEIGYGRRVSKQAAQFFLDWVYERARQIKLTDPQQRSEVLDYHRKARDYWQDVVAKANAE